MSAFDNLPEAAEQREIDARMAAQPQTAFERACRALCKLDGKDPDADWTKVPQPGGGYIQLDVAVADADRPEWTTYRRHVHAVLEAIREPDTDMLLRGQHAHAESIRAKHVEGVNIDLLSKLAAVAPSHATALWHAMIDQLLASPPPGPEG